MDFGKLAPWNWFKKEEGGSEIVPQKHDVKKSESLASLHDLHTEFNKFFDSLKHGFGLHWPQTSPFQSEWFKPSLDVASDDKEYTIKVELPGIDSSDISIEYSNNTLKIKGEKHQESEEKKKDYYRVERSYGSFQRVLDIPEDGDTDNITSSYKNGVLSITIPKKALPSKDTKKIEIKTKS